MNGGDERFFISVRPLFSAGFSSRQARCTWKYEQASGAAFLLRCICASLYMDFALRASLRLSKSAPGEFVFGVARRR